MALTLNTVRKIPDPKRRAERAAALLRSEEMRTETRLAQIRALRDQAGMDMLACIGPDGKPLYRRADVARALGVSRSAIAQRFPHLNG